TRPSTLSLHDALPIYRAGRSPNWLKIRADRTDDFVVVGFTRPKGSRSGFGALDLGAYQDGKLVYGGRVGSGFTDAELKDVSAARSEEHTSELQSRGHL